MRRFPAFSPLALPLLLGLGALVGCGTPAPDVLIGTGELEFEPLEDGDEIQVIRGPQGGFHVHGSMRAVGIDGGDRQDLRAPNNPTTSFHVMDGGVALAPNASFTQGLDESTDPDWAFEMIGRLVILDITDDAEVDGHEITLEVQLETSDGAVLTDSRTLTVVPHPLNDNAP